ncbi:MAG: hypothetical protein KKD31_05305 [Bacteroidetes bacterium]|nr:hypothetical protein [Bacteroidota bacterium]
MKTKNQTINAGILVFCSAFLFSCSACSQQTTTENSSDDFPFVNESDSAKSTETVDTIDSDHPIDTLRYNILLTPGSNYAQTKKHTTSLRDSLKREFDRCTSDSARNEMLHISGKMLEVELVNNIFPYWYGTGWEFSGYTDTPGKGTIACGYFVSTTLKHAGFNLNRYKLAQQSPEYEAYTFCISDTVQVFDSLSPRQLKDYFLENMREGLYFVGLDFHVGFLLLRNDELFFIHSNYLNSMGPVIEIAEFASVFPSFRYYIAQITTNKPFIKKWLSNELVDVKIETPK